MKKSPVVAVIMGSESDWKIMKKAVDALKIFEIPFKTQVVSAHRTPQEMQTFAISAEKSGFKVVIAGAGGAAHLPGMVASLTTLPVIGVPVELKTLKGLDSILSILQMPKGIPVATVALNNAFNAGLLAARMLGLSDSRINLRLKKFHAMQKKKVLASSRKISRFSKKSY